MKLLLKSVRVGLVAILILLFIVLIASYWDAKSGGTASESPPRNVVPIKLWVWGLVSADTLQPILNQFEQTHPNIKVYLTVISSLDYQQKLPISLSMHENLDVVGVQPNMAANVAPYLMDIGPLMSQSEGPDWQSLFKPADMARLKKTSNTITAIPVGDSASMLLYYNASMFKELDIQPPNTYEDWKQAVRVLQERKPDVLPVSVGAKEGWILDEIVLTILSQKSDLYNRIRYNLGGKWDSPEYADAVGQFKRLSDNGIINTGNVDMDDNRAYSLFTSGKAAMYIQGSWRASLLSEQYKAANKIVIGDVGITAIPVMEQDGKPVVRSYLDFELGISKDSKHPQEAAELVRYFTTGNGADELGNSLFVVPSKTSFNPDSVNLVTDTAKQSYQELLNLMANAKVDRNNMSAFSDYVGQQLQKIMLSNANIGETVKKIQKEFDTRKY